MPGGGTRARPHGAPAGGSPGRYRCVAPAVLGNFAKGWHPVGHAEHTCAAGAVSWSATSPSRKGRWSRPATCWQKSTRAATRTLQAGHLCRRTRAQLKNAQWPALPRPVRPGQSIAKALDTAALVLAQGTVSTNQGAVDDAKPTHPYQDPRAHQCRRLAPA